MCFGSDGLMALAFQNQMAAVIGADNKTIDTSLVAILGKMLPLSRR